MMVQIFSICLLGCRAPPSAGKARRSIPELTRLTYFSDPTVSHPFYAQDRVVNVLPIKTASPVSHAFLPVATGSYQVQRDHHQHRLVARSPQYGSSRRPRTPRTLRRRFSSIRSKPRRPAPRPTLPRRERIPRRPAPKPTLPRRERIPRRLPARRRRRRRAVPQRIRRRQISQAREGVETAAGTGEGDA